MINSISCPCIGQAAVHSGPLNDNTRISLLGALEAQPHLSPTGDEEADEQDGEDDSGQDAGHDDHDGAGRAAEIEPGLAPGHGLRVRHT